MTFSRMLLIGTIVLVGVVGTTKIVKKVRAPREGARPPVQEVAAETMQPAKESEPFVQVEALPKTPVIAKTLEVDSSNTEVLQASEDTDDFPSCDRILRLFTFGPTRFPFVETINYTSNVSWLKGRPAWLGDYAQYYNTSRHFIARSLNGKPDYFSQKVSPGQRFNVFKKGKNIQFHLLVDLSRLKMGFYCIDLDANQRFLLKTYTIGVGKQDDTKVSGCLTPLGKFSLDNKLSVVNKPGDMGYFKDEKVEIVSIFGSRWIPVKDELEGATAPAKGVGLHGAPWEKQAEGKYLERRDTVGGYVSGGGIRLFREDIEELYAIILSKPTVLEVVRDFHQAKLPGIEEASPSNRGVEVREKGV